MNGNTRRVLALTVLACAVVAQAQSPSGSVQGVIRLHGRKPLPGASVQLKHLDTGKTFIQESSASGEFTFPGLAPGDYEITVNATGMKAVKVPRLGVTAGQTTRSNIKMDREDVTATVNVVAVEDTVAAKSAPSQGSLTARSAQSEIREEFVRNYIGPVADYTQVVQMAPGMFSFSPNGPGLGDTKTYFRGFSDGDFTIAFDGIPFQDTNSPTHHSWAFFPGPFLGGAVVDRSPGTASNIGPTNYGGSINLLSRVLEPDQRTSVSASYGSWNTKVYGLEYESGNVGRGNLMVNAQEMKSDGYQTFNTQKQDAFSAKFQFALTLNTQLTAFASYIDLHANTPNIKGATRAQIAQFGDNYLLQNTNPALVNYVPYNFYHVVSDFEYLGLISNLGGGWKLEDKLYTYYYHNKQNYDSSVPISVKSAVDKLNGYRTTGNIFRLSDEMGAGTFRTGLWSEIANTNRYQIPADPRTWIDQPLPNFHEKFTTTLLQPFAEYEFKVSNDLKVTPGLKYNSYRQDLTQFADNGKTVGSLGGAPYVKHSATYTAVLPFLDVHYMMQKNWAVYVQYATGDEIPPSSVFDVKNGAVAVLPKSTRNTTLQAGSVFKSDAFTLDMDAYHISFDNAYSTPGPDPVTGLSTYYANGKSVSQGIEAESNINLGGGFNLYVNATTGTAKYSSTGLWIANAPRDTESLGLYFQEGGWNVGLLAKRVGKMFNDNGGTHEAVAIDPFVMPNLFVNYTTRNLTNWIKQAKFKVSVNNLTDKHSIVSVAPAATSAADVLTLLPARSISLSAAFDF